jgi:catalase
MSPRLTKGPVVFRVLVQLAEPGDNVTDSTSVWPETRTEAEFGILTLKERVDELAPERRKMIFDPLPRVDDIDSRSFAISDFGFVSDFDIRIFGFLRSGLRNVGLKT